MITKEEEITLRILDSYCKQNRSDSYNFTMYELVNMYEESLRRVKEIYKKEKYYMKKLYKWLCEQFPGYEIKLTKDDIHCDSSDLQIYVGKFTSPYVGYLGH